VYQVWVGKPDGKRPLGRPRPRWEDGIRIDLREIGLGGVDWIRLAQDRDRWRAVVSADCFSRSPPLQRKNSDYYNRTLKFNF
jgi:hypothetical protein